MKNLSNWKIAEMVRKLFHKEQKLYPVRYVSNYWGSNGEIYGSWKPEEGGGK